MHHCVATYADRVQNGEAYIYSVRKSQDRMATVELHRHGKHVSIGQIRGACNSQVSKEIEKAVQQWYRLQKEFRLPSPDPDARSNPADLDELDIPF